MTEKEAIEELKYDYNELGKGIHCDTSWGIAIDQAYGMAIKALEEIQQYRAIGTVEECRDAVEKLPVAEEVIRKLLCSEYGSSCQFCIHDNDRDAMCCKVGGSGSWCCKNAKWNGRLE